jgi:hypothetical protein
MPVNYNKRVDKNAKAKNAKAKNVKAEEGFWWKKWHRKLIGE